MMHHIFLIAAVHNEYMIFSVTASFLLLIVNYVIFEVYDWISRNAELRGQNRLYAQQLELCSQQAEERESLYLEIRRLRHDLKIISPVFSEWFRQDRPVRQRNT